MEQGFPAKNESAEWFGRIERKDRRKKVAIISCYDQFCGIAGYTRAIEIQLAPHLDLTTFDLDQELLRSKNRRIQKLADQHILEIAAQLKTFDSVNIQLEHGTLGHESKDIIRRFKILAGAAKSLSVTFHTVMMPENMPLALIWSFILKAKFAFASNEIGHCLKVRRLSAGIYGYLRKLAVSKPVSIIVHTKRDMRMLQNLYRLKNIYDHPLSSVAPERAAVLRQRTSRADFPIIANLPAEARLVGTFGFLSAYKGFETAIQSLRFLPDDYHLLIFGGVHPQNIKREQSIDPYIEKILSAARFGQTPLDHLQQSGLALTSPGDLDRLLAEHPQSLRGRIHFMGALPDDKFYSAMAICDVTVFPYLEVGQSSSGPISIALEMGAHIIASRTGTFRAFAKYHPEKIEFFDIGNYAELAERILAAGRAKSVIPKLTYNTESNVKMYLKASGVDPSVAFENSDNFNIAAE